MIAPSMLVRTGFNNNTGNVIPHLIRGLMNGTRHMQRHIQGEQKDGAEANASREVRCDKSLSRLRMDAEIATIE